MAKKPEPHLKSVLEKKMSEQLPVIALGISIILLCIAGIERDKAIQDNTKLIKIVKEQCER